jgi:dienelactone hydrolase
MRHLRWPRRLWLIAAQLLLLTAAPAVYAQGLLSSLREEIVLVPKPGLFSQQLETTYFRPAGNGPFPWVIINHGKAPGDPRVQPRARYLAAARELVQRGYAVVVPMRQGFSKSTGAYIGGGCNVMSNGLAQAEDVKAALQYFATRPELDPKRVLLFGQSHGGLTTLAAGTLKLPGVLGLVNFAGGLRLDNCLGWENELAEAFGRYGRATPLPALFFYGDNDSYWSPPVWQNMVRRYTEAGGRARVVAFGNFGRDAHALFGSRDGVPIWLPEVERFVRELGLPFSKLSDIPMAEHQSPVPPATDFAPLADAAALPYVNAGGREGYAKFLAADPPKAFAIGPGGAWTWRANMADAMQAALERCAEHGRGVACKLYAVDDRVVWSQE